MQPLSSVYFPVCGRRDDSGRYLPSTSLRSDWNISEMQLDTLCIVYCIYYRHVVCHMYAIYFVYNLLILIIQVLNTELASTQSQTGKINAIFWTFPDQRFDLVTFGRVLCQSYTQNGTSAAQHKTQGKRKADRWKKDYERRREEYKTLLDFPSPKSLNYFWLLLIFYFNIVHLCGPITYNSLLGLACAHNTFTGIPVDVLLPVIPHMRCQDSSLVPNP